MSSYRAKSNRFGSKGKVVVRGPRLTAAQSRLMARAPPRALLRTGGRLMLNSMEMKNFDVGINNPIRSSQAAAVQVLLCCPGPGSAASNRIGRRIKMKSLQINFKANYAGGSTGQSPIRVLIVYDRQTNTGYPAATDVLQADQIYSMRNLDNQFRFDVLLDKVICPNFGQGGVAQQSSFLWKKYIKLNHGVQFNTGASVSIADIETGSLIALIYQDGNITTANPSATWFSRVRYTD